MRPPNALSTVKTVCGASKPIKAVANPFFGCAVPPNAREQQSHREFYQNFDIYVVVTLPAWGFRVASVHPTDPKSETPRRWRQKQLDAGGCTPGRPRAVVRLVDCERVVVDPFVFFVF